LLLPPLLGGPFFGSQNLMNFWGLTAVPGAKVTTLSYDQVGEFMPSTIQVWTQVHHGHLPLWNPLSGLGMPLAFNWQSAPFGLPALVGYLFPMRYAYTVGVIVVVLTAGFGAYVFGRVLHLGIVASAFAGTVFALSGPFAAWLGWPIPSVMSWSGWLFAAALLVIREHHRIRWICFLAVVIALLIFAGYPESCFLVFLALAVFVLVQLAGQRIATGAWRPVLQSGAALAAGAVAGLALAAPLLLPGVQLVDGSVRSVATTQGTLPAQALTLFLFDGFDTSSQLLRSAGSIPILYVGAVALALALLALLAQWRQFEVIGLGAVLAVMVMLFFVPGVAAAVHGLPVVGTTQIVRAEAPAGFALAMLSGVGLDVLVRSYGSRHVRALAFVAFGLLAVVLVLEWVFGRNGLTPGEAASRNTSFVWPAISVAIALAVLALLVALRRRGGARWKRYGGTAAACILLLAETAFLSSAAATTLQFPSTDQFFPTTPAVRNLQHVVDTNALVGTGTASCGGDILFGGSALGFLGETNIAYGVHSLIVYDPILPRAYFSSWTAATGASGGYASGYFFCPAVTTAAAARLFGVRYILEPHGAHGPIGAQFVASVGNGEDVYHVPGASAATLTAIPVDGVLPPDDATGTPVAVRYPSPSTWHMTLDVKRPSVLRLHLTDVPGWHATVNGRPLALTSFAGIMMQARLPPGHDVVQLSYWPTSFTIGLVLFAVAVIGLSIAAITARRRGRSVGRNRPGATRDLPAPRAHRRGPASRLEPSAPPRS
jgi:hypothetical protein